MIAHVNGFTLDVTVTDGRPHVRVSMKDVVVLDTDKLSVTGLKNMAEVCETAASIAYQQLDEYYALRYAATGTE